MVAAETEYIVDDMLQNSVVLLVGPLLGYATRNPCARCRIATSRPAKRMDPDP